MAERRMFSLSVVDSDAFLDMPLSSQALYFHLSMRADDDGFVNNPKKIQRTIGASDGDAEMLVVRKFIMPFETGVVVIRHWRINNLLRRDRYRETVYQDEKKKLSVDDVGVYSYKAGNQLATNGQPNGNQLATQYSIGKDSKGKSSIGEDTKSCREEGKDITVTDKPEREVPTRGIIGYDSHEYALSFMDEFNSIEGVKKCVKMHYAREISISTICNSFTEDEIYKAFDNLRDSDFLRGKVTGTNGKAFQCDFDWFINLANFTKVLEGKYNEDTSADQAAESKELKPEDYLNQGSDL